MARNKTFHPENEPFRHTDTLQLNDRAIHGPVSFLNPTRAHFDAIDPDKDHVDSRSARPATGF